jgi:uncharacterized protein with PQ loop repeat
MVNNQILNIFYEIIKTLPGVCFISSDFMQFIKLVKSKNIESFEPMTYILFIIVNFTQFIFANKINVPKVYFAMMGPAFIDSLIIAYNYYKKKEYANVRIFVISLIVFTISFFSFIFSNKKLVSKYSKHFGIIPSFILPLSVILQIYKIYKNKNSNGVSSFNWTLQLIGSASMFLLLGQYTSILAITQTLLVAFLCFILLLLCLFYSEKKTILDLYKEL